LPSAALGVGAIFVWPDVTEATKTHGIRMRAIRIASSLDAEAEAATRRLAMTRRLEPPLYV
jgi:hypothetical protein